MKLYYRIKVIEDIIVSQSPATANTHSSLDYIPGSAILGAIATQSYEEFGEKSWDIFHNAQVIFSNAYIAHQKDGSLSCCFPTPLSWHFPKGESLNSNARVNLKNHAHSDYQRDESIQEKQCRTDYISSGSEISKVKRASVTKTAINSSTQTVEESQLFSYNYIEQDQVLIGYIEADENTINDINPYLENISRIGRSRNSEFGEVSIQVLSCENSKTQIQMDVKKGDVITIWLISDCQLLDENGFLCLTPDAKLIGLENAELDLSHSFISSQTTTLFNRKRERFDSSQILLKKGSILVYRASDNISSSTLTNLQAKGIGINQQLGLGQMIINPQWSNQVSYENGGFFETEKFQAQTPVKVDITKLNSALCDWIEEKVDNETSHKQRNDAAIRAFKQIISFYQAGRQFNSIDKSFSAGPNKTQWGLLYQLFRNEKSIEQGEKFKEITAINSTDKNNWDLAFMNPKITTFSHEFQEVFNEIKDNQTRLLLLEKLKSEELDTSDVEDLKKNIIKVEGELT